MSATDEHEQRQLLDKGQSTTTDTPPPSGPTAVNTPKPSPARHRPGYARVPSISVIDESAVKGLTNEISGDEITQVPPSSASGHGLGIAYGSASDPSPMKARRVSIQTTRKAPVSVKGATETHGTPDSAIPLMSPPSTGGFSGSTRFDGELDTSYSPSKHMAKQSVSSLHSTMPPSVYAKSDAGLISIRSRYDDFEPHTHCRSEKRVKQKLGSWISATILALAVFSTLFSAIFLVIALRGPRYGRLIHTKGPLTASSAAFLTSFFAKLIELSFVTVFVAFLGQALARRAHKLEADKGVTLAELSMRTWIMQPGTILTHWESVRYAGITVLGGISLLAALVALLYSTAATALVQPQLKFPQWSDRIMYGQVLAQFADPTYIESKCQTPITDRYDPEYATSTCIELEHAAMAYHNYFGYLSTWTDLNNNGTGETDLAHRPKGHALLNDNTTVIGPFIERTNITKLYEQYGIVINNVSMAMPHSGVLQAAVDPLNDIMQPDDLDGLGVYSIRASVPSPVVHVLCTTLNKDQLKPFVYAGKNGTLNATTWPDQLDYPTPRLSGTPLDNIFGWGELSSEGWPSDWAPMFAKPPKDYNTIFNDTTGVQYGRASVYLLGKGGPIDSHGNPTSDDNYSLCQLKVSQTPDCWTQYNASARGGTLEAICEDHNNQLAYNNSLPTASRGSDTVSKDWPNIASEWGWSLSLNAGVLDGNGSNSRLLTQLIVTVPWGTAQLNPALPSMAEALAVMAGCTLLQSTQDAPFVEFWNYTLNELEESQHQAFNASLRAQQYASGGTQNYQKAFYLVLFTVFAMNVVVLIYFVVHRDWYTDFSEPAHLFTLAVNSPPSKELAGSCGGGPQGDQFRVNWKLHSDGDHVYMESQEQSDMESSPGLRRRRLTEGFDMMMTPVKKATERFEARLSR